MTSRKVPAKCTACQRMVTLDLDNPRCVCGERRITMFWIQMPLGFAR